MKQLQLVTHTQAVKLQRAGFDWECSSYYNYGIIEYGENRNWNAPTPLARTSAPSIALALKWMRDEKRFRACVKWLDTWQSYIGAYFCRPANSEHTIGIQASTGRYDNYEEAEVALLDKLLTLFENES